MFVGDTHMSDAGLDDPDLSDDAFDYDLGYDGYDSDLDGDW